MEESSKSYTSKKKQVRKILLRKKKNSKKVLSESIFSPKKKKKSTGTNLSMNLSIDRFGSPDIIQLNRGVNINRPLTAKYSRKVELN